MIVELCVVFCAVFLFCLFYFIIVSYCFYFIIIKKKKKVHKSSQAPRSAASHGS